MAVLARIAAGQRRQFCDGPFTARPSALESDWLISGDEASLVPGNYHSKLPHLAGEQGLGSSPDISRLPETGGTGDGALSRSTSRSLSSTKRVRETLAAARERLKVLPSLPLLDITPEVAALASGIPASGKIPRKAATDAAHIAIAAVHGMDFLVTWNCVHIANAAIAKALASTWREHGCECPGIRTPEGVLGE